MIDLLDADPRQEKKPAEDKKVRERERERIEKFQEIYALDANRSFLNSRISE